MKKYIYLTAAVIICLLLLQQDATAQPETREPKDPTDLENPESPIYTEYKTWSESKTIDTKTAQPTVIFIKVDELFKNVVLKKDSSIDNSTLDHLAKNIVEELSGKANRERETAKLLRELQDKPNAFIKKYSKANANSQQNSLQESPSAVITNSVREIVEASSTGADDPLSALVSELESSRGQELLNNDLYKRFGSSTDIVDKVSIIILQIEISFNKEALDKLRQILKSNKNEMIRLPYPLCLLRSCRN